jgi:hypothetical protein
MLRKTVLVLEAVAGAILFAQSSYAVGGADVADPMRRTAAAFATNPAQRCQNISGSQWWFTDPNCRGAQRADPPPSVVAVPRESGRQTRFKCHVVLAEPHLYDEDLVSICKLVAIQRH